MWQQNYTPMFGSVGASALTASIPIFVVLLMLGVWRKPAWMAAITGLLSAIIVALFVYQMPVPLLVSASLYGAAFGFFQIAGSCFGRSFSTGSPLTRAISTSSRTRSAA